MKSIITLLIFFFALAHQISYSQNDRSAAFSKSYEQEYLQNYPGAISALNAVYESTSYEINLRLGWLTYLNGDFVKSQTYYKTAMKLESASIEAKLGYAYPTAALENWEDVINIYHEILLSDPGNATVNSRLAHIYYDRKDFKKASQYAEKVRSQYPFNSTTNLLLGRINISMGKLADAKAYLKRALLYDPTSNEVIELLNGI